MRGLRVRSISAMNCLFRTLYNVVVITTGTLLFTTLGGCGGGESLAPAPVATAPTKPPVVLNFDAVAAAIDAYSDTNFAVIVGDRSGILFERQKGDFPVTSQRAIASATKWYTSATIMRLVDKGRLSLSDNPQRYLTYWSSAANDARSRVTLEQLLSFTSGFNTDPVSGGCTNEANTTLQACAQQIYNEGQDTAPGAAYSYGPEHMHIAAAMAEVATGKTFAQIFEEEIVTPLGMSASTRYVMPSTTNPLVSGGAASTARDYALFLRSLLANELVADRATFLRDRTVGIPFLLRPQATVDVGDWHYALGAWVECKKPVFDTSCADARIFSSPGSYGWTPWIDLNRGYFAIVARRGERFSTAVGVRLEQQLQPLIEQVLAR
jgi:serine-type D-Ala-D-Ala carboxypeptidase/endopeptidase